MSILKTTEKEKVKFLMDFDYNNILGRLKYVLGKDASFFAEIRVKQHEVTWSTRDDIDYNNFSETDHNEQLLIKEKIDAKIAKLTSLISGDSLLGPHIRNIISFPSNEYIYYKVRDGEYNIILAGWGCDTTDSKEKETNNKEESVPEAELIKKEKASIQSEETGAESDFFDRQATDEPLQSENKENIIEKGTIVNDKEGKLAVDTSEKTEYTSEWLKKNTNIHGWLSFFLFAILLGGAISAIYPIVTYNPSDYAGVPWLGATDIIMGIELLGIALYTTYAFCQRKENAVFYGRMYVIIVFITNIISIIGNDESGHAGIEQNFRGIIWGIIWFLYLLFSKQVQEIIPLPFRKVGSSDWCTLFIIILIPVLCFVKGILTIMG